MKKNVWRIPCLTFLLAACGMGAAPQAADDEMIRLVRVARPTLVRERLTIAATGVVRARREVPLSFSTPGQVVFIQVREGDMVSAGQLLARLESTHLSAEDIVARSELAKVQAEYKRQKFLYDGGWVAAPRIEAAQAALDAAESRVRSTQFDVSQAAMTAPGAGVVLTRHVEPNQVVSAGQPILTLAETSEGFVLRAPVTGKTVTRLQVGAAAEVTLEGFEGASFRGHILEIGAKGSSETGNFEVEIELPTVTGLRSGLVGNARLSTLDNGRSVMAIPALAIFDARADEGFVYVVQHGKAEARLVKIAGVDGSSALIARGLETGEWVIVSDIDRLRPGMAVRLHSQ